MMLRAIYSMLLWLGLPLIVTRLWLRARREPGYSKGIGERFGRYAARADLPVLWVHAVSVGEVRASAPLVNALRARYPGHTVLVTCMTAAGREAIDQVFGATVLGAFLPYDFPFAVRRFLDHFRPRLGVLVETEIWINLLAECRRRGLPVVLASGRMSQGSARAYRRLSGLTRPAFEGLAVVCAQSEADANRIASLGAHQVSVAGNLKFDVVPDPALLDAGAALKRAMGTRNAIVLASTREGEEALLLDAFRTRVRGEALLIVVPRHPQRFESVAALVTASGLSCARRSLGEPAAAVDVLLGDTMGEMPAYYAAADVAVVGGSLLPYGGQNLIEACAIGVPVIIGPHVHNFSEVVRMAVDAGAAMQVEDAVEAADAALALLDNPGRRAAMGSAGAALCLAHRGATDRHIAAIERLLQR
ncbi:MAG: lipid IV(A) 3-deoxy-D-manno-octulosonic acid transferase [Proteobacteria bacterium]|nr:lipid IV(A) 3-deoxy-D-manno-octulosonic acid transferase [Pseudomonadota bacterium]